LIDNLKNVAVDSELSSGHDYQRNIGGKKIMLDFKTPLLYMHYVQIFEWVFGEGAEVRQEQFSRSYVLALQNIDLTQRICRAWGYSFARGFARVILDRLRDNLDQAPGSRHWGSELDADTEFNFSYPPSAGRGRF
jgi:hypothetical protein